MKQAPNVTNQCPWSLSTSLIWGSTLFGLVETQTYSYILVLGYAPYDSPDATFAFTVVWRNGSSTRVWTGQCFICTDGAQEKLLTSWLQRSQVNTCIDKWKSTMLGRDVFTRCEEQDGPCNPNETPPTIEPVFKNWDPEIHNKSCNLNGNWYNLLGSEMIVEQGENSRITGEFRTAVEREKGTVGTSHSTVLGIGQFGGHEQYFCFLCDLQEWCICSRMGGTMPPLWRKQNRDHRKHVAPAHSDR